MCIVLGSLLYKFGIIVGSFLHHFEIVLKMLKPTVSAMGDVVKVKIFLLAIRAIRSWQMERGIKSRYFSENFFWGNKRQLSKKANG